MPGYDLVNQRPANGVSATSLLSNLYVDDTILKAFNERGTHGLERVDFGKALGAKQRGTIAWRMHSDYAERLHDADLRRFDWTKAQQLRGSALKLWMVFTSTRVPYRSVLDSRDGLEMVEIPLTLDHCNALGVYNSNDAGRRRTLNEAGERVCAVDRSFQSFEAHGGRGQDSFLRVVRKPPLTSPLARPFDGAPQELRLLVA